MIHSPCSELMIQLVFVSDYKYSILLGWCFITEEYIWPRMLSVYLPLVFCWLLTSFFIYQARTDLVLLSSSLPLSSPIQGPNMLPEMISKLTLIPILFVILRVWGAVYRLWWAILALQNDSKEFNDSFDSEHMWLHDMVSAGDAAQGFSNFIIFVLLTSAMRDKIKRFFCRWEKDRELEYEERRRSMGYNYGSLDIHKEELQF